MTNGLTIVTQEPFIIEDIYVVCLYDSNMLAPSIEDLPMYPNAEELAGGMIPQDRKLIVMYEYMSDVHWIVEDPSAEDGWTNDVSMNLVTYYDMETGNPIVALDEDVEAQLKWNDISKGNLNSMFVFRYNPEYHPELNTFDTIILYGVRDGQPYILSYGYLNDTIYFDQIESVIVNVEINNVNTDYARAIGLYVSYDEHSERALPNLATMHPNLRNLISNRTDTQGYVERYRNARQNISLDTDFSFDKSKYMVTYNQTQFYYALDQMIPSEQVLSLAQARGIATDVSQISFNHRCVLSFDRFFGMQVIYYGNWTSYSGSVMSYIIVVPTGYNKVGLVFSIRSASDFNTYKLLPTIKVYENNILLQYGRKGALIELPNNPTGTDRITVGNKTVEFRYYSVESINFDDQNPVTLPIFDIGNMVYYWEPGKFKNLVEEDVSYPNNNLLSVIELRFRLENLKTRTMIGSEYMIESEMDDYMVTLGVEYNLYDTGALMLNQDRLVFFPFYPSLGQVSRYEIDISEFADKEVHYFVNNRIIYAVVLNETALDVYEYVIDANTSGKFESSMITRESITTAFASSRGIIVTV